MTGECFFIVFIVGAADDFRTGSVGCTLIDFFARILFPARCVNADAWECFPEMLGGVRLLNAC